MTTSSVIIPTAVYDPLLQLPVCLSKKCEYAVDKSNLRSHMRKVHELPKHETDSIVAKITAESSNSSVTLQTALRDMYMATTDKTADVPPELPAHSLLKLTPAWACAECGDVIAPVRNYVQAPQHSCRVREQSATPRACVDSAEPADARGPRLRRVIAQSVFGGNNRRLFRVRTARTTGDAPRHVLLPTDGAPSVARAGGGEPSDATRDGSPDAGAPGGSPDRAVGSWLAQIKLCAHMLHAAPEDTGAPLRAPQIGDVDAVHTQLRTHALLARFDLSYATAAYLTRTDGQPDVEFLQQAMRAYAKHAHGLAATVPYIDTHDFLGQPMRMSISPATVTQYANRCARILCFLVRAPSCPLYAAVTALYSDELRHNVQTLGDMLAGRLRSARAGGDTPQPAPAPRSVSTGKRATSHTGPAPTPRRVPLSRDDKHRLFAAIHAILRTVLFSDAHPCNEIIPIYIAARSVEVKRTAVAVAPHDAGSDARAPQHEAPGNAPDPATLRLVSSNNITHAFSCILFLGRCWAVLEVYGNPQSAARRDDARPGGAVPQTTYGASPPAAHAPPEQPPDWTTIARATASSKDNGIRYIRYALGAAHRINRSKRSLSDSFNVCDAHYRCAFIDTLELPLATLSNVIQRLEGSAWAVLRTHLLHGIALTDAYWARMSSLTDEMRNAVPDYSFTDHPANRAFFAECRDRIFEATANTPLCAEPVPPAASQANARAGAGADTGPGPEAGADAGQRFARPGGFRFPPAAARRYVAMCDELHRYMFTLVHLTSGAPARFTEWEPLKFRNTADAFRNIFITCRGLLTIITSYHKSQVLMDGEVKFIARFPGSITSGIVLTYIALVRPLEEVVRYQLFQSTHAAAYDAPAVSVRAACAAPGGPGALTAPQPATLQKADEAATPRTSVPPERHRYAQKVTGRSAPHLFLHLAMRASARHLRHWFKTTMAAEGVPITARTYRHYHVGVVNNFLRDDGALASLVQDNPASYADGDSSSNDDECSTSRRDGFRNGGDPVDDATTTHDCDGSEDEDDEPATPGDGGGRAARAAARRGGASGARGDTRGFTGALARQRGHGLSTSTRLYATGRNDHRNLSTMEIEEFRQASHEHHKLVATRHGAPGPMPSDLFLRSPTTASGVNTAQSRNGGDPDAAGSWKNARGPASAVPGSLGATPSASNMHTPPPLPPGYRRGPAGAGAIGSPADTGREADGTHQALGVHSRLDLQDRKITGMAAAVNKILDLLTSTPCTLTPYDAKGHPPAARVGHWSITPSSARRATVDSPERPHSAATQPPSNARRAALPTPERPQSDATQRAPVRDGESGDPLCTENVVRVLNFGSDENCNRPGPFRPDAEACTPCPDDPDPQHAPSGVQGSQRERHDQPRRLTAPRPIGSAPSAARRSVRNVGLRIYDTPPQTLQTSSQRDMLAEQMRLKRMAERHAEHTERREKRPRRGVTVTDDELTRALCTATGCPDASFRSDSQRRDVRTVVNVQTDWLFVRPTGSGKTLLFLIPALVHTTRITVVVCPLLALQHDLLRRARTAGIDAVTFEERNSFAARLVVVAAEHTEQPAYANFVTYAEQNNLLHCIVLDEAHLALTSAQFRTSMATMHTNIRPAGARLTPLIALTATSPPTLTAKIAEYAGLRAAVQEPGPADAPVVPAYTVQRAATNRTNLAYIWVRLGEQGEHVHALILERALFVARVAEEQHRAVSHKFIVYAPTREHTEELCAAMRAICNTNPDDPRLHPLHVDFYHAGVEEHLRDARQRTWQAPDTDRVHILCATNAFGCGIDCKTVRAVFHVEVPATMLDYAQESGRAGRDGLPSYSFVFSTGVHFPWKSDTLTQPNKSVPRTSQPAPVRDKRDFHPCYPPGAGDIACRRFQLTSFNDGPELASSCTYNEHNFWCDTCCRHRAHAADTFSEDAQHMLPPPILLSAARETSWTVPDPRLYRHSGPASLSPGTRGLGGARAPPLHAPPSSQPAPRQPPPRRRAPQSQSQPRSQRPAPQPQVAPALQRGPTPDGAPAHDTFSGSDVPGALLCIYALTYANTCAVCSILTGTIVQHDTDDAVQPSCYRRRCYACGSTTHGSLKCPMRTWGKRSRTCFKCNLSTHNGEPVHNPPIFAPRNCLNANLIRMAVIAWETPSVRTSMCTHVPALDNVHSLHDLLLYAINYDSKDNSTVDSPTCGLAAITHFLHAKYIVRD